MAQKIRDRECPVPGCDGHRARGELACPACWFIAPKAMRDRVWKTGVLSDEGQEARDDVLIEAALKRFGVVITRDDLETGIFE